MALIQDQIVIHCPPEVVFDFVADERNEPKYNPHMVWAEPIFDGPVGNGTRFVAAIKSMGHTQEVLIEFTDYSRPTRLASTSHLSWMDIQGTLTFEPDPEGTRMGWSWDVRPKRYFRIATPLIARMGKHQEAVIWRNLKRLLEGTDQEVEWSHVRSSRTLNPDRLVGLRAVREVLDLLDLPRVEHDLAHVPPIPQRD